MKITCPHCKRAMSFADDKLRDYLDEDAPREDEGNQPARQTWIMIIIVAAALASIVGFGGGTLLTRPSRSWTATKIGKIQAASTKEVQQANQKLDTTTQNLQKANARIAQLERQAKQGETQIVTLPIRKDKPDKPTATPTDTISAIKLSKPFFGVYLGETITAIDWRQYIESSTMAFVDPDHPGKVYDLQDPPEGVSTLRVLAFRNRVYAIEVKFSDTTTTNLNAITKRLELKYGKNTTGRFSGSMFGEASFAPTIDGVDVWISINRDVGIGEPDTLTLTYRHSILAKVVQGVLERQKTKRVGEHL